MSTHGLVQEHGFRAYVPLPKSERAGIGVCFSGGGYRASLFHAGAVRRLNEVGLLTRADTITSVSGGSIMTAQLATYRRGIGDEWEAGRPAPRFDQGFAEPLRRFTQRNIRTRAVLGRRAAWATCPRARASSSSRRTSRTGRSGCSTRESG